jgi:hypothetical protein
MSDEEDIQASSFVHRQDDEEEEVQTKTLINREESEEEEIQRSSMLQSQKIEEEEEVQTKKDTLDTAILKQSQMDEDEGEIQTTLNRESRDTVQSQTESNEEEGTVQSKNNGGRSSDITPETEAKIMSQKGGGQPLSDSTRAFFEPRFGHDFSKVRVHKDHKADESAKSINAQAYTSGSDIVFSQGRYSPDTRSGKSLLAHELTHTIQLRPLKNIIQMTGRKVQKEKKASFKEGTIVNKLGIVNNDGRGKGKSGVELMMGPERSSNVKGRIPFNTKVFVVSKVDNDWYYIHTEGGDDGYVYSLFIWTHLPEPNAKLHRIKPGQSAIGIAEQYYKKNATAWGRDLRYFVNVLVHINNGDGNPNKGIHKAKRGDSWKNTKTISNYFIWIPSVTFARLLAGKVKSGSITYGIVESVSDFIKVIKQKYKDLKKAIILAKKYIPEAIKRHAKEAFVEILTALAFFLIGGIAIIAVTTAIGAAIGALFGGVGAGPGAAIGFKVGLFILKWLGVALLLTWLTKCLIDIGNKFWSFIKTAWRANGKQKLLDNAAKEFAEALGVLIGCVLQGLVLFALAKGLPKIIGLIGKTRFGKWIGRTKLIKWLLRRIREFQSEQFARSISKKIKAKIPKNWIKKPNRKGVGHRWIDPKNPNNSVRIDKGNPKSTSVSQRVDHIVVNSNGQVLGRNGLPIRGTIKSDAVNAHIPLSVYINWSKWNVR